MRIDNAEVIPIEVPLSRTFYGGTYSMNRRCTLLLRLRTSGGVQGQIYIGDERDQQAAVCRILQQELFPNVLGRPGQRGDGDLGGTFSTHDSLCWPAGADAGALCP